MNATMKLPVLFNKTFNEDIVSFYLFCFLTDNSHARINTLRFAKDSSIELFELYRVSKNSEDAFAPY